MNYQWFKKILNSNFYIDREQLLKEKLAKVLIHPNLYLNNVPVTLSILEQIELKIERFNEENVPSTISDFSSVAEFQVSDNYRKISFPLQVKLISKSDTTLLSSNCSVQLNNIDDEDKLEDEYLQFNDQGYFYFLAGKTGEPKSNRVVNFKINHYFKRDPINQSLQTDENGQIFLGTLKDIQSILSFKIKLGILKVMILVIQLPLKKLKIKSFQFLFFKNYILTMLLYLIFHITHNYFNNLSLKNGLLQIYQLEIMI